MTPRGLARLLGGWLVLLVIACGVVRGTVRVRPPAKATIIASRWLGGKLVARALVSSPDVSGTPLAAAEGALVYERVVGEGPILRWPEPLFALSLVPSRDGVRVDLDGKTAYVTPDDLVAHQAYDHGVSMPALSLNMGVDVPLLAAIASGPLGAKPIDVQERATFRRIRTERTVVGQLPPMPILASSFDDADVRMSAYQAARYLARGVSDDGHFHYLVNAASGQVLSGYDWPRHAGATYFVAQVARRSHDIELRSAALRAAGLMRNDALRKCGRNPCVAVGFPAEIGSSALAVIAFSEIVRAGLDDTYLSLVRGLADFLLAQQRPDGEFMHQADRDGRPIDVQFLYFSGEATLALARANQVTGDPRYLEGAKKGLAHLVGPAWSFFGDRYYFGEEHWTCQAMGDLWDRAPDPKALDFCLRWQAYDRGLQLHAGDCAFDCDGALGLGPLVTPRLTPVASRCEAGVATLEAATKAGVPAAERAALKDQLRHSLALLMRQQLRGRSAHLMADPAMVYGAMPGSLVDWQLRIDYAQHAGSAMVRWLDVDPALRK